MEIENGMLAYCISNDIILWFGISNAGLTVAKCPMNIQGMGSNIKVCTMGWMRRIKRLNKTGILQIILVT